MKKSVHTHIHNFGTQCVRCLQEHPEDHSPKPHFTRRQRLERNRTRKAKGEFKLV